MLLKVLEVVVVVVVGVLSTSVSQAKRSNEEQEVTIKVDTSLALFTQSEEHSFICATLDWWPSNKCDSEDGESNCAWVDASILTAPLSSESRLKKAISALGKFTLRLGGTLADSIIYDVGEDHVECPDFSPAPPNKAKLFTDGCLTSTRWEEILQFCPNYKDNDTSQCDLIFGINAMTNRTCVNVDPSRAPCFFEDAKCSNTFDFSNAERIIRATAAKGYSMKGYEFGNELTCLSPQQYAESLRQLNDLVIQITQEYGDVLDINKVPHIIATDSKDPDPEFFSEFIPLVEDFIHAATWHSYPLNAGVYCTGPDASNNSAVDDIIMDPHGMDKFITDAYEMNEAVKTSSPVQTWMGETGGAYDSGCRGSTNTFMSGFWYLNSLGGFALNGHDMFCRQTLTGGNYELINKVTNIPNPDFYSTLLFGKLMGKKVLGASVSSIDDSAYDTFRVYAHCTPILDNDVYLNISTNQGSVTILYLNYAEDSVVLNDDMLIGSMETTGPTRHDFVLTGVHNPLSNAADALHSDLVALNGKLLTPHATTGDIPLMTPHTLSTKCDDCTKKLTLPGLSYGYIVYPNAAAAACL